MKKKDIRLLLIAVTILLVGIAIATLSVTALPGSVAPESTGLDYDVIIPISSQDGLIEDELPSIGEVTIDGNFSDPSIVSPNATPATDTVLPDGVYALRNVGNGQLWMGIERNYLTPGYHMQQYAFGYSPADNFTQAGLFKVSKKPGTDYYIIRSMLNNLLSFGFSGNEVLTKTIPADDASVALSDTFTITYVNTGYVIKPYGSSYGVCANDTTASGAAGAPNSYLAKRIISSAGDQAIWAFEKYTGANQSGVTVKFDSITPKGFVVDTSYTIQVYTWTTLINANQPYAEIASSDSEIMTGVWNATTNAITITGKKVGKFCLYYRIRSGNSTVRTFYSNFLCIPPIEDGVNYFIQNVATKKYMDIEGPSTAEGAIIQQWSFSTANQKKWIFTRTTDGYFTIKSRYSNKYVGVDSTNTSVIRQYGTVTDYTKWYFAETESGNYALHCKASAVTGVLASPSDTVDNGVNLTTTAYTDDTNYRDEWLFVATVIKIDIIADHAYNARFANSSAEITDGMAVIQQKYLQYFGILIDYSDVSFFESLGDLCDESAGTTYMNTCSHAGNENCENSSFSSVGNANKDLHHKNLYNIVYRIPFPDTDENTLLIFSGHNVCRVENGKHEGRYNGLSWSNYGVALITNFSLNEKDKRRTVMHEIGHWYGAPDHYDNGDIPSTEEIKIQTGDSRFNRNCIYGENRFLTNVVDNLIICGGCKARIIENIRKYSHESS